MIETYLLEQLAAFEKFGTLSEAASKLYVSQPALSRSMKKLERIIGVELFSRAKNRIALNDNGKLAAIFAQKILDKHTEMINAVREFDRKSRTISVGSCAPVPLEQIRSLLEQNFSDMAISSELNGGKTLLRDFQNDAFQLVVLNEKPEDETLWIKKIGSEKLFISLPPGHPLAKSAGIYLRELNGLSVLIYSKIGFWYDLCVEKAPRAHFLLQNDSAVFEELARGSEFPSFTTDIFIDAGLARKNRVNVPILDAEASANYYLVCKKKDLPRFEEFLNSLEKVNWNWRNLIGGFYFTGSD